MTTNDRNLPLPWIVGALLLALGMLGAGWFASRGLVAIKTQDRYGNTVSLRTNSVDKALAALRQSGKLVGEGVMIGEGSQPDFDYTKLNDIKPALIAEATANARESAVQFAKDSGARLGGIRSANQGVVTISDRDQSSPQVKKVRVVTTVEYFLKD